MGLGNLRNRKCSCDKFPAKKYSDCCWDKDYWAGFSKTVSKIQDEKTGQEKEFVRYFKTP